MTSSATQTDEDGRPEADDEDEVAVLAREPGAVARPGARLDLAVSGALLVGGWVLILFINGWHVGAPPLALCLGWLAILLSGRFFWNAALTAAADSVLEPDGTDGFDRPSTRGGELELEKRALLKAIKEVEFDREMGKMSEADAAEITRVYRARAIEILKETDGVGAGGPVSLDQIIEREVRARLALAGVTATRKKQRSPGENDENDEPAEKLALPEIVSGADQVAGADDVAGAEVASARDEVAGAEVMTEDDVPEGAEPLPADDAPSPDDARENP